GSRHPRRRWLPRRPPGPRPCARRRTGPRAAAPPCVRRSRRYIGPASPNRRRGPSCRPLRDGGHTEGYVAEVLRSSHSLGTAPNLIIGVLGLGATIRNKIFAAGFLSRHPESLFPDLTKENPMTP